MKGIFLILFFFTANIVLGTSYLGSAALALWLWYVIELFENSTKQIAFREFIMVLYGLNYLCSPAISYVTDKSSYYRMKIPEEQYFLLAIPSILLLQFGMNVVKTQIFRVDFKTIKLQAILNQGMLKTWLFAGVALSLVNPLLPSDLAFLSYLLSAIRFVAVYGLFSINPTKYKWYIVGVLSYELARSLKDGMFHDTVMWTIFFGIFWAYLKKPQRNLKLAITIVGFVSLYLLQVAKAEYRQQLGKGGNEAGLALLQSAVLKNVDDDEGILNSTRTAAAVSRMNQAWIFASVVKRIDQTNDFQELAIVNRYAEAAFLPRFLAPNKLRAGDKEIFNRFSGHYIASGTSMGLGFFADGYVAFGAYGTYLFALILGLIFSLIFRMVESWSRISPFFILLIFPILNYAVRPDCETQTIMGHIVKGVFVFGLLVWYYSNYFSRKLNNMRIEEESTLYWKKIAAASKQRAV